MKLSKNTVRRMHNSAASKHYGRDQASPHHSLFMARKYRGHSFVTATLPLSSDAGDPHEVSDPVLDAALSNTV